MESSIASKSLKGMIELKFQKNIGSKLAKNFPPEEYKQEERELETNQNAIETDRGLNDDQSEIPNI